MPIYQNINSVRSVKCICNLTFGMALVKTPISELKYDYSEMTSAQQNEDMVSCLGIENLNC